MSKKIIPLLFAAFFLAGSIFTSCHYNPVINHPPCDTCCDTCKKPCDTCTKPCDTCNLNKDSLAHAFSWQQFSIPGETDLTGCWVFGPNDIIIVGNSLWHFDGTNFTDLHPIRNGSNTPMDGGLNGFSIFAFSQTDYWLVSGSIAFHTSDGIHFDDNRKGAVNACWGTSSKDMFFIGNGGNIFHYDGTNFTNMTSNTTQDLYSVWGTDHNHVWACGWNYQTGSTAIVFYNGSQWNIDDLTNSSNAQKSTLSSTWSVDSTLAHTFTVVSGAYVFWKTDNNSWRVDTTVPNINPSGNFRERLYGVRGNTADDLWLTGDRAWVGHWSGKSYHRYDQLYDPSEAFQPYGAEAISVNNNIVCFTGTKAGNSWVAIGTRKQ